MPRPSSASSRTTSRRTQPNSARPPARPPGLIFSALMPSAIGSITPTVQRVVARLQKIGVLDGHREAIEVALNEALANAVLHGNRKRTEKRVRVSCYQQRDGSILLIVRDSGNGFDPAAIPNPTETRNVTRNRGRGLFLIRHFMDDVRFADNGREIRMRKR